jgi:mono/diheme cytochrome c family protein
LLHPTPHRGGQRSDTSTQEEEMNRASRTTLAVIIAAFSATAAAADKPDQRSIERGRYLVTLGGCNDCHTVGYPESGGKTPETDWLTGSPVGFQGPWGTTYPANLRVRVQGLSEDAWIKLARAPMRPPMPWFNLAAASDADLRAMYRYIRSLGAKGAPAPAYAAPGQAVTTPYIDFMPKNLPAHTAAK